LHLSRPSVDGSHITLGVILKISLIILCGNEIDFAGEIAVQQIVVILPLVLKSVLSVIKLFLVALDRLNYLYFCLLSRYSNLPFSF